jgi:hypothetical protein
MDRFLLGISAPLWFLYGLYCFFAPAALEEIAGVVAIHGTASAELRAMYGGLQMALGALCGFGFANPAYRRTAIVALLFLTLGLGLARLGGALLDDGFSAYTGMGFAFEFGTAGVAALALRQGSAAAPA